MNRSLDRAWELYWLGRYEATAKEAVEHLRVHADCVDARRLLAHAQQHLGRHGDALATAREAVAKGPDSAAAHHSLAIVLYTIDRYHEAKQSCEAALRLDAENALAWNLLASCLGALGSTREALLAVERALAIDPERTDFHVTKAWLCERLGDAAAELAAVAAGLQRDPNRADLLARRARLLAMRGDQVGAREARFAALRAQPAAAERRREALTAARLATPLGRLVDRLARSTSGRSGAELGAVLGKLVVLVAAMSVFVVLHRRYDGPDPEVVVYAWVAVLLFGAHCNDVLVARHAVGRTLLAEQGRRGLGLLCLAALVVLGACGWWLAKRRPPPAAIWSARIGFLVLVALALRLARSIERQVFGARG